jgi:aminopeptidase N
MSAGKTNRRPFAAPDAPRTYARSRTYDVRHIRIELDLDERKRSIKGFATLTLASINDGLRSLDLDLSNTLRVHDVQDGSGRALRWEHHEDRVSVQLRRSLPAGREFEVRLSYAGAPRRGLYFVTPDELEPDKHVEIWSQGQDEDSRYWFPCFDSPHDKFTSEMIATVRQPFSVVSNGRLVEVRDNKRRQTRTFHWREDVPHPAYLVSIVVGEYDETSEEVDGVRVSYHVHERDRQHVARTFGRTPEMMRFFSSKIDYPYPYEKYAQVVVQDFIFGGMENVSATTLTDAALLDERAALETDTDALIAHELAHQWWGNLLTCKEWSHAWLNEGFATYFEALFTEHHVGQDEFLWQLHTYAEGYFAEDETNYRRPIVERRFARPIEIFDRHLYEKGALVLHMLRHRLGDALFWKAIRHYARKYEFQNVETADFKRAIEEATGQHMDAFFDQWVFAPGYPTLEGSWHWDAEQRAVVLTLKQTQERDGGTPLFALPLDVELYTKRGPRRQRCVLDQSQQSFYVSADERPRYVRLDPEHWILKRLHMESRREELLAQLDLARDLFGQIDAARELRRFVGDGEVHSALRRALRRARFFAVRGELALSLAVVAGSEARDALFAALSDKNPRARWRIVRALGELRQDAHVLKRLQSLAERERSYIVRAEILRTLSKLRAPDAFQRCRGALRERSWRDRVRVGAFESLAELEDERGIELALQHAERGHGRWERAAAMKALAQLGRSVPTRARSIQDALERYLGDPSFFACIAAAEALGGLGRSQAVAALRRLERSDVDRRIQRAASEAIRALSDDARTPDAWRSMREDIRALKDENRELHRRLERLESKQRGPSRRAGAAKRRDRGRHPEH